MDTDEFFVLTDPHMASLPDLLQEYEEFGGLAVNWQVIEAPLSLGSFHCAFGILHSVSSHASSSSSLHTWRGSIATPVPR